MRLPSAETLTELCDLASRNGGYVTREQALATGLNESQIRTLVRRGEWAPVARGLRRVASADADTRQDRLRQALLRAGPASALAGHTAAELHGIVGAPALGLIWIAVPRERHPQRRPGIRVLRTVLAPGEVATCKGMPVVGALRAVMDSARYADLLPAVCLMESAVRQNILNTNDLRAAINGIHGQCGSRRALTAFERMDLRSESPLETKARLMLLQAGFPYPELQHPFAHGDRRRIDLAYLAPDGSAYQGLAIEIDGRAHHAKEAAFHADPRRQTALEEAGWLVRRFTDQHLGDPDYFVQTVRRGLDRVGFASD